jgi:hypothetical protein
VVIGIFKVASIALAGTVGVVGILKDFAEDAKSQKWKRIALAGVIMPTAFSMALQVVENAVDKKRRDDYSKRAAETTDNLKSIGDTTKQITESRGDHERSVQPAP